MRIDIITVFKSENCGSFMQAWALKEQLSSMENSVFFRDYKSVETKLKIRMLIICGLRLKFKRIVDVLKKTAYYKKSRKNFGLVANKDEADLYFFGSDTLWNFGDKFFRQNIPFFTGAELKKPCYTYSMSIGSTSEEVFMKQTEAIKNIQKFKKIAVRDSHTEKVISKVYPCEHIVKTVDPTLLIDKETYVKCFSSNDNFYQKSLVIYYFGSISESVWKALEDFAQKRGLKLINIGLYGDRKAQTVTYSPSNFISAFANAEYIFTNTFHGCVFSTIFNKPFATDGIHKKKIEDKE